MVQEFIIRRFALEPGEPVLLPRGTRATFIEYADGRHEKAFVLPDGDERLHEVFTLTLRPDFRRAADMTRHVTPPGMENVVQSLKKKSNVDNPWAVAWAMKNKEKSSDHAHGDDAALPEQPTQFPSVPKTVGSIGKDAGKKKGTPGAGAGRILKPEQMT